MIIFVDAVKRSLSILSHGVSIPTYGLPGSFHSCIRACSTQQWRVLAVGLCHLNMTHPVVYSMSNAKQWKKTTGGLMGYEQPCYSWKPCMTWVCLMVISRLQCLYRTGPTVLVHYKNRFFSKLRFYFFRWT